MAKEGYKPTSGMQAAARRAIKLKEQGKAKGAGTMVGWTRAGQLARGESLSLNTVKRMYSYFSRHEVDKKGKDWDNAENPSNGKIMWLAWGGDAGFSWSRKIVNREKNMKKSLELNEFVEEIKDILDDVVNPITKSIEIKADEIQDTEGCKCNGCKECKANGGCDMKMCKGHDNMYKAEDYESDDEEEDKWDNMAKACWTGYTQRGMKEKDGRMVPNCVPVEKMEKSVKAEVSKETLLEVIKELQEIIVGMVETEDSEVEDMPTENDEEDMPTENDQEDIESQVPTVGNPIQDAGEYQWGQEAGISTNKSLFSNLDPYDLIKRDFTTAQRERMAESGHAMPDGSYPIGNKNDLMNAIRSWGRGGSDPKVKSHIKRRAKELGLQNMIPDNWK